LQFAGKAIRTNEGTAVIRNALATLAALAALSGAALPAAQALPTDTAGTPGGGQSSSPDGSSETKNDNRYQSSIESGLVRGAQQQCDEWHDMYATFYKRAKDAEANGDQETASFWYAMSDKYLAKWTSQCYRS
jgi:hypothetical protein